MKSIYNLEISFNQRENESNTYAHLFYITTGRHKIKNLVSVHSFRNEPDKDEFVRELYSFERMLKDIQKTIQNLQESALNFTTHRVQLEIRFKDNDQFKWSDHFKTTDIRIELKK